LPTRGRARESADTDGRIDVRKTYKLYVGGAFPRSESGRSYDVHDAKGAFLANAALASRKVDVIAGNSTDGRIAALDLFQLEDDKKYFPPYQAVFVIRRGVKDSGNAPENGRLVSPLVSVMGNLSGAISTDDMRKLNYEVDGAKRDKKVVVHEWLLKKGFVK